FTFFFQAEDGIRDFHVTGVQTCALPILPRSDPSPQETVASPRRNGRGALVAALPGSPAGRGGGGPGGGSGGTRDDRTPLRRRPSSTSGPSAGGPHRP